MKTKIYKNVNKDDNKTRRLKHQAPVWVYGQLLQKDVGDEVLEEGDVVIAGHPALVTSYSKPSQITPGQDRRGHLAGGVRVTV